jgi:hypothetical protein
VLLSAVISFNEFIASINVVSFSAATMASSENQECSYNAPCNIKKNLVTDAEKAFLSKWCFLQSIFLLAKYYFADFAIFLLHCSSVSIGM